MIKVGCAGYPVRQSLYHQLLQFVEVGDRSGRRPREVTLKKWRTSAPKEFEFVIHAPQVWIDPVRASGLRWNGNSAKSTVTLAGSPQTEIRRLRDELGARVVVFDLPPHFTATPDRIARFQTLIRSVPSPDVAVVWTPPRGWPETLVERLSYSLNIVVARNPLKSESKGKTDFRYFRIKAPPGSRHTDDEMKKIRRACGHALSYVVFDVGPNSFSEATRFARMAKEAL